MSAWYSCRVAPGGLIGSALPCTNSMVAADTCCADHRVAAAIVLAGAEWPPLPGRYVPPASPPCRADVAIGTRVRLVSAAFSWLRPGGRLVVADMMFGHGASSSDRKIIAGMVKALARKGPAGWWRVAKNAARYLLRIRERPVPASTWTSMLRRSGFDGVTTSTIAAEAGLVTGRRPAAPAG